MLIKSEIIINKYTETESDKNPNTHKLYTEIINKRK